MQLTAPLTLLITPALHRCMTPKVYSEQISHKLINPQNKVLERTAMWKSARFFFNQRSDLVRLGKQDNKSYVSLAYVSETSYCFLRGLGNIVQEIYIYIYIYIYYRGTATVSLGLGKS